jgi:hypothetical protein
MVASLSFHCVERAKKQYGESIEVKVKPAHICAALVDGWSGHFSVAVSQSGRDGSCIGARRA